MYYIIHLCFAFVCLVQGFPEDGLKKIETFRSLSGLHVKVCVCVVVFVRLWVQSVKSHYHALLQTKLPKMFRLPLLSL
jgi:hypothetical protein